MFREVKINYQFIFELDPDYRVTHHQIYEFAFLLLFVLLFCLVAQFGLIKYYDGSNPHLKPAVFTIICILAFGAICCSPYKVKFQPARISLHRTIHNIIIAPFGLVQFRHFFLTAILTSMTSTLTLLGFSYCYFTEKSQAWKNNTAVKMDVCPVGSNFIIVMGFIPFWLRFA